MICKNCGAELKEDSAFCTQCGKPLNPENSDSTVKLEKTPEDTPTEPLNIVDELLPNDTEKIEENLNFKLKKETVAGAAEDEENIFPEPEKSAAPQESEPERKIEAEPEYPAEAQPEIPRKDKAAENDEPINVGAARITGAAFISIFAVIALLTVNLLLGVKLGATGDMLGGRVKKMDVRTVISADIDGESFSDRLYDASNFGEASQNYAEKKDFQNFLTESGFLEFAAESVKKYADFIFEGSEKDPSVSANDIVDFYVENGEISKNIFNYELTSADYTLMRRSEKLIEIEKALSVDEWSSKLHFRVEHMNFVFSYVTIGIFAALFLVLIIWITVVVDKQGRHLLGFYGNIFCWSGILTLLIGGAATAGMSIAHVITGEFGFYIGASLLLPFGLFLLCFGAGELTVGVLLKNIKRAVKNKQKRNAAVEEAVADVVKERIRSFS